MPASSTFALASQLEDRSKQSEAEKYFREAIRVMPRQVGPEADLGLLYMRVGREDEARTELRAGFRADPFNVRVKNSLEVLDVLHSMQTLDSERFAIKYNGAVRQAAGSLCRSARGAGASGTVQAVRLYAAGQDADRDLQPHRADWTGISGSVRGWWACRTSARSPPARGASWRWRRPTNLKATAAGQLGSSVDARVGPRRHASADAIQLPALVHRRAGGLERGRAAAGQVERAVAGSGGEGEAVQSRHVQLRFRSAEVGRRLATGVLPGRIVRGVHACDGRRYGEDRRDACSTSGASEGVLRQMLAAYTEGLNTPEAIRRVFGMSQAEFERGYMAFLKQEAAQGG